LTIFVQSYYIFNFSKSKIILKMKKLYFVLVMLFVANLAMAQRQLIGVSPVGISGRYESTHPDDWGGQIRPGSSVEGELAIGIDSTKTDSLQRLRGCVAVSSASVRGKIALIRRGECEFGAKALNAQNAGAIAVIIYQQNGDAPIALGAGAVGAQVTIPVAMISLADQVRLTAAMATGPVRMKFFVPSFFNPVVGYSSAVPQREARPLRDIAVGIYNGTNADVPNVQFKLVVTDPNNASQTLTTTLPNLPVRRTAAGVDTATFVSLPVYNMSKTSPKGVYNFVFTNSFTADTVRTTLRVTDFMFAHDRGTALQSGTILLGSLFTAPDNGLRFDMGNVYLSGADTSVATHAAFALGNIDSFPANDEFTLQLYKVSAANYAKLGAETLTYDDMATDLKGEKVLKINRTMKRDSLLFVEWPAPVALDDSSFYLTVVRYEGITFNSNLSQSPAFTHSVNNIFPTSSYMIGFFDGRAGGPNAYVISPEGFGNDYNPLIRLYMRGFRPPPVGTKEVPAFGENQITILSNPISEGLLNLQFNLDKASTEMAYQITNLNGQVMRVGKFQNVQNNIEQIDVRNFVNGNYFITLSSKEGWRTKVFTIAK
jgi:hypothetical protein